MNAVKWFFITVTAFIVCATGVFLSIDENERPMLPGQRTSGYTASSQAPVEHELAPPIDWAAITPELQAAVTAADEAGITHAKAELAKWHGEMMQKVDENFLPWYFGYWRQQGQSLTTLGKMTLNWFKSFAVDIEKGTVAQETLENMTVEFENQVMPGPIVQQRLEAITVGSANIFQATLSQKLAEIPRRYSIPAEQWDKHLNSITIMVRNADGSTTVPFSLKSLSVGTVIAGGKVMAFGKAVAMPAAKAAVTKTASVTAAKAATGLATKGSAKVLAGAAAKAAGGKAAAAGGGSVFGPVGIMVAVGALAAWEAWDHSSTVATQQPILRANIEQYLLAFEEELVKPEGTIGGVLSALSSNIYTAVAGRG